MKYVGSELELFLEATNWKKYFASRMRRYISGDVLEVGAGLGANTPYLLNPAVRSWALLEPDGELLERAQRSNTDARCTFIKSDSRSIPDKKYDCIIYLDVLEHILDHETELARAFSLLAPAGHLIVLAPAHNALYSNFDKEIGHHRRYSRKELIGVAPRGPALVRADYLDSVGVCASFANKYLLKQSSPNKGQIRFWDKVIVPLSVWFDRLLGFHVGKSLVVVWKN